MGLGRSPQPKRVETLTKEQKALLNQFIGGAQQGFGPGLEAILTQLDPQRTEELFQQAVADPALRSFQQQVIPSILQSSANLGAKGGSNIERQLARAGTSLEADLASQLAALQFGQQQQGIANILGLGQTAIGQPAFALQQPSPSPLQQLSSGLIGGAFGFAPSLFGR